MKIKIHLTVYLFVIVTSLFAMSCSGTSEHEHSESMKEDENHAMEDMEHSSNNGMDNHTNTDHNQMLGQGFTWDGSEASMSMMEYKTENIRIATSGEKDILLFEPAGSKASCMFKNMHNNVGVTATLKFVSADATVKLVHHSTGNDNYEFVSLGNNVMILGRVENGEEKVFDTKEVGIPDDWFTLTVTAAGTHYKGYLNDKMITHGHGDVMEPGLVGIVASGNGMIEVKKVEATPLKAEE